jgi:CBS domain-containing protein
MRVDRIRSKTVATVNAEQTLNEAAHLMWTHDCGCVPVVDDAGVLKGMLTDRDIAMAAYLNGSRLADIPVSRVMSREVVCCRAGDDVLEVESRMQQHRIRRLAGRGPAAARGRHRLAQ